MYKNTLLKDISEIALVNMAEMLINKLDPTKHDHVVFYLRLKEREQERLRQRYYGLLGDNDKKELI